MSEEKRAFTARDIKEIEAWIDSTGFKPAPHTLLELCERLGFTHTDGGCEICDEIMLHGASGADRFRTAL